MKKNLLILFGVLFLAVVFCIIWVFTSRQANDASIKNPVKIVLSGAVPLLWLDNQNLLVSKDNKIIKYDIASAKVKKEISDYYTPDSQKYESAYECFSPEGGVFPISNNEFRWIKDWNNPGVFEKLKIVEWWNTNPNDCSNFEYDEEKEKSENPLVAISSAPQLVKKSDGLATLYTTYESSAYRKTVSLSKGGNIKKIDLGLFDTNIDNISTIFDRTTQQYFWYYNPRYFNFNADSVDPKWPIKGWWVSPNGAILDTVIILSGPWTRKFSFWYSLRWFSCGPECYSYYRIYAGGGNIYVEISGDAVDISAQGVYQLDAKEQKWNKLISKPVGGSLVISPNGCQLSYSIDGKMQIMDVCQK